MTNEGKHVGDWDSDCAADGTYDFPERYDKYRTREASGFVYDADYDHGRHVSGEVHDAVDS